MAFNENRKLCANKSDCVSFAKTDTKTTTIRANCTKVRSKLNSNAMFMRLEKLLFSSYVAIYYWWWCAALPFITPHGIFQSTSSFFFVCFFFLNSILQYWTWHAQQKQSAVDRRMLQRQTEYVYMLMPTAYVCNLDAYIFTQNIAFYVNASSNLHEINIMQSKRGFFGISFT